MASDGPENERGVKLTESVSHLRLVVGHSATERRSALKKSFRQRQCRFAPAQLVSRRPVKARFVQRMLSRGLRSCLLATGGARDIASLGKVTQPYLR